MALVHLSQGETERASFADRILDWRNRLLMNARFQRLAASFPLTRGIARRRQRQIFDMVAGFVYSQVLQACVRLGLLETLSRRPLTLGELGPRLALAPDGTRRIVHAATSLGLVEPRSGGRYGLGEAGAAILGNPGVLAMIHHHALFYADLADPVALLTEAERPTELSRFWAYARADDPGQLRDEDVAAYSRLMAVSQTFIADEVLGAVPLAGHRHLLDVCGGEGAFITAVAARHPGLRFTLVDLPAVARRAEQAFENAGLADRAQAVGANVFADPLPAGADVATLVRVLHDHDRPQALTILKAVRAALAPGATLVVAEPMADARGAETVGAAYFAFYLLAMKSGEPRSAEEIMSLAREAGFAEAKQVATHSPLLTSVITARA